MPTTSPAIAPTGSTRARNLRSSAIRDILDQARRPGMISLAGGVPDAQLFPIEALTRAYHGAVDRHGPLAFQYGPTLGEPWFRDWAATDHGDPRRIVAVTGSQQGLDLLAWCLLDPGDEVIVADPDYLGALQAFDRHGARLHGLPIDADGLDLDALERHLRRGGRPRACYVVANHHNPTGATLAADRRRRLVELAERYGFWIIDDDPYGQLRLDDDPPPPPFENADQVIRLRTVSKTIAPGLRIGWLDAPPPVVALVERAKQSADLHTATLAQAMLVELELPPDHLGVLRRTYRTRRDALVGHLDRLGGSCTSPAGGLFVWVRLSDDLDTTDLLRHALARGVAFVPGAAFAVAASHRNALRLSYATADPAALATGIDRLGAAIGDLLGTPAG